MADQILAHPHAANNFNPGATEYPGSARFWPTPAAMSRAELNAAYQSSAQSGNFEQSAVYADALLCETVSHTEDENDCL
jgi:hypothetical protein